MVAVTWRVVVRCVVGVAFWEEKTKINVFFIKESEDSIWNPCERFSRYLLPWKLWCNIRMRRSALCRVGRTFLWYLLVCTFGRLILVKNIIRIVYFVLRTARPNPESPQCVSIYFCWLCSLGYRSGGEARRWVSSWNPKCYERIKYEQPSVTRIWYQSTCTTTSAVPA